MSMEERHSPEKQNPIEVLLLVVGAAVVGVRVVPAADVGGRVAAVVGVGVVAVLLLCKNLLFMPLLSKG